ncbi:hypothetical protein [Histophilus somni]|uniref:hypothetical protein n=1 Tax=Histophilus somni TaxID=731 RepID=UPI00094A9E0C|nr:hypothetical protein [Histophilus somni]
MKKILSNLMLISFCSTMLTACPSWVRCADWNCSKLNPRWVKAVDTCETKNLTIVLQVLGEDLGYKSLIEVQDSKIGQHISTQCIRNDGRYNIEKDKKYGHLFAK